MTWTDEKAERLKRILTAPQYVHDVSEAIILQGEHREYLTDQLAEKDAAIKEFTAEGKRYAELFRAAQNVTSACTEAYKNRETDSLWEACDVIDELFIKWLHESEETDDDGN